MRYYIRKRDGNEIRGPFTLDELESQVKAGTLLPSQHVALADTGQTPEELQDHSKNHWATVSQLFAFTGKNSAATNNGSAIGGAIAGGLVGAVLGGVGSQLIQTVGLLPAHIMEAIFGQKRTFLPAVALVVMGGVFGMFIGWLACAPRSRRDYEQFVNSPAHKEAFYNAANRLAKQERWAHLAAHLEASSFPLSPDWQQRLEEAKRKAANMSRPGMPRNQHQEEI